MTNIAYGVYGASGFGREVMPLAKRIINSGASVSANNLYFIDANPPRDVLNDQIVLKHEEFLATGAEKYFVCLAISESKTRELLAERCSKDGIKPWSISAENVVIMDDVEVGEGAILNPFVTLTSNIRIGKYFHANIYSYVAHDCVIGDYVTFAPAVRCNGNVVVEDHAYIGTGAIIRQGKPGNPIVIGAGATVGMGAVVTKSVAPGLTVVGNPARPLVKE